jgi:hypothetical protein
MTTICEITNPTLQVCSRGNYFDIKHSSSPASKSSPLDYLEVAVAGCIAICLVDYIKSCQLNRNPFGCPVIRISNNTIYISVTQCEDCMRDVFERLVDNCYICSIVSLKQHIDFQTPSGQKS